MSRLLPVGAGGALSGVGEALHQVAQARDALLVNVKGAFVDPLQSLHDYQLKEIRVRSVFPAPPGIHPLLALFWLLLQYQLKKVNSRRLDFDYKRRRSGKVPAGEIQQAWGKFVTSKELAEGSMFVLLQNDVSLIKENQSDQLNVPKQIKEPNSAVLSSAASSLVSSEGRSAENSGVSGDRTARLSSQRPPHPAWSPWQLTGEASPPCVPVRVTVVLPPTVRNFLCTFEVECEQTL